MSAKSELYNLLANDPTLQGLIGNKIYWLGNPLTADYPYLVFSEVDTLGIVSFGTGGGLTHEMDDVLLQIDIHSDYKQIIEQDAISIRMRDLLTENGYTQFGGAEQFDEITRKITKATRWSKLI